MTGPYRNWHWIGLAAGAGAWAVSTQTNYVLAGLPVAHRFPLVPVVCGLLVILALAGAAISWLAWRQSDGRELLLQGNGAPYGFFALMSAVAAALFALVIMMQGVAGLVLPQ